MDVRNDVAGAGVDGEPGLDDGAGRKDDGGQGVVGISVVCVFNDEGVRRECLDASIAAYGGVVDVDYIPVDNRDHQFSSAGAALNHGARLARHPVVAFAHQDVYLHSIDRLLVAASAFAEDSWGLLGANGVAADGENVGRIRDRTQLIGRPALLPVDVDSVDEVLFLVPRSLVLAEPLSEHPDLAWHAYAVEYSLRMRAIGRRTGAIDLAVTHNSLTVNLARLDVAHRAVGELYPQDRPIRTTCGTVGERSRTWRDLPSVRRHGWRLRWLRHSLLAAQASRQIDAPVVLSDIRHEVDLLSFSAESPLQVFTMDRTRGFVEHTEGPLHLHRLGKSVVLWAVADLDELFGHLQALDTEDRVLVVDVTLADLAVVAAGSGDRRWLVGIHPDTVWLLGGAAVDEPPEAWSERQAIPLGSSTTRASAREKLFAE